MGCVLFAMFVPNNWWQRVSDLCLVWLVTMPGDGADNKPPPKPKPTTGAGGSNKPPPPAGPSTSTPRSAGAEGVAEEKQPTLNDFNKLKDIGIPSGK